MSRAIVVEQHGGPEVLTLRDRDVGAPGPGQARVAVHAAGVNFIDTYQRSGAYQRPTPFVLGSEGAGVVEAVGPGVERPRVGERVAWASVPGSYAEHVIAPVAALALVPASVSTPLAAAALLQGMTAHYLSRSVHATQRGDRVLVHAAAGGTGQLLVQLLKSAGAFVIGTCSTEEKAQLAKQAGCDAVIRYDQVEFAPEVKKLTDGRGVDVVYDSVGRTTFDGSLASLRPRGLMALFGQSSGAVPPFDLQRLNQHGSLFITRPSLMHYIATREEFEQRAHEVFDAIGQGALKLRIDQQFPLAQAAEAHRYLEARRSTGKLVLLPTS
jgi:NADPH2:quinone reductase